MGLKTFSFLMIIKGLLSLFLNFILVAGWVLAQRADCTSVSLHHSQLTHYPHPLSLPLFLGCHWLQNHRNKLEGDWIPFPSFHFCPLFQISSSICSHTKLVFSINCSSCHTSAHQETVGGHLWSCGCKCIYKYVFILTCKTITSAMFHYPPPITE